MMSRAAAALALAACSFAGPSAGGDGVSRGDCGDHWGERAFVDPCVAAESDGKLRIDGEAELFSDTGDLLIGGADQGSLGELVDAGGVKTRLIALDALEITGGGSLRITGAHPVAFAVDGAVDVSGSIDVSSFWDGDLLSAGAGADPGSCPPSDGETPAGLQGVADIDGGGGGGGGGFGGTGGTGGRGRDDNAIGGGGGAAVPLSGLGFRGGCPGGRGGEGEDQSPDPPNIYAAGLGGSGGGALLITATGAIEISGILEAGGAGGRGQTFGHRHGGGGGGSGGLIALEGPAIEVGSGAIVAANGGGGGGGANNLLDSPDLDGADAQAGDQPASGAAGGDTNPDAAGGDGGALASMPEGGPGTGSDRGGGGGGGGVGHLVLIGEGTAVNPGATVSPEAAQLAPGDL